MWDLCKSYFIAQGGYIFPLMIGSSVQEQKSRTLSNVLRRKRKMKQRVLAVILAMTLAMGMSMTAMAEPQEDPSEHGGYGGGHGTDQNASSMVPNRANASTQFYINVDKDATSGETKIDETEPSDVDDASVCHEELEWEVTRKSNVSVTVPLYVCMYGYGGDGKVVTPSGNNAYKMQNYSTYSETKTLKGITPCYGVNVINDNNKGNVLPEETSDSDIEKYTSGQFGFYCTYTDMNDGSDDRKVQYQIVPLSACVKHSDLAPGCQKAWDYEYFFRGEKVTATGAKALTKVQTKDDPTEENLVIGDSYAKFDPNYEPVTNAALSVNVPTIKATPGEWGLLPMGNANELQVGQIVMSIGGVDLSDAIDGLDIRNQKWVIDGPDPIVFNNEGTAVDRLNTTAGSMPLPIQAQIAGGSVNEEGCVPVVKVEYTFAPNYEDTDTAIQKTTGYEGVLSDESQ
jgi:hypothetical protein